MNSLGRDFLIISVNKVVEPNNLHGCEFLELLPVNMQVPDVVHLFFLLGLGHYLLDRLIKNVVGVSIEHITLALVVAILGDDVF